MQFATMLQLSNMLIFWGMLAMAFYAANGSASRAAIARYTESSAYLVQLVVVAVLSPLLQFGFGAGFETLTGTMSSGIAKPSLAAAYAAFTLLTILASLGFVALVGGMAFRNVMADLFAPIVQEPEQKVSTAAD